MNQLKHLPKVVAFASLVVLSACTEPFAELEGYVKTTLAKAPPQLEPIPPIKDFPVQEYPIEGLRDPFETGEEQLLASGSTDEPIDDPDCPDLTRNPEDLEEFPLDALDMVGTMAQSGGYFGLVKDPDGVVHRVQVNNYLGQNYGQILSIAEDKIELEERVKEGAGCERKTQTIALEDNN
jgi:type IV pilus assembly protein PilP